MSSPIKIKLSMQLIVSRAIHRYSGISHIPCRPQSNAWLFQIRFQDKLCAR